jgi:hypothetical protein
MSRNPDRCPTHPGELLREDVIPATKKSKAEIARTGRAEARQRRGGRAPRQAVRERTAGLDQDAGGL